MITVDTPIFGRGGTLNEATAYLDRPDAADLAYAAELFKVCQLARVRFDVAFPQFCHETADATSPRWLNNRNPAGLGIASDDDPDPATFTPEEAARVHVWALQAAAGGNATGDLPDSAGPFVGRWIAKYRDPNCPTVRTVADLGRHYVDQVGEPQATWGWDERYAEKIAAKANQIFKEDTMPNLVIGKAERPTIRDDIVNKPQGMGWDDYGPRTLRAVVLHRVVGAARYTSGHFRNLNDPHGRNALTDWGVCGALDGDWDGVILKWNDPDSRRSPWASGPLFDNAGNLLANGDAVGFYQRYVRNDPAGANVVNRDTEAIEFSGMYDTPLTRKQLASGVALIAYRIDVKMRLPWSTWPKNHDGEQAILWHGEIMGWQKPCAGAVVIASTDTIINLVGERLKTIQERAEPTPTPEPPVVQPPKAYRPSHARLAQWFGQATVDGRVIAYDRDDPIATIWRQRGKATGSFPAVDPTGSDLLNDGTLILRFEDGWVVTDPKGKAPPVPLGG